MNDTAGISKLQQQYNELVAEFSKAYPREITDNDGQKIKIEFVELRKDIRTSGSYLSLGFVPLFQHTYMDINILEARSEQKARLFAGSFTPVRQIPYSVNKYNAHQGKKECERRRKQAHKQAIKFFKHAADVLDAAAIPSLPHNVEYSDL